ncbi:MAG: hypothetical protein Q4C47_01400 [Planctomycetia bacterium]|nr:hypothetical protein [Planctomycetia bacterium]
MRRRSGGFGVSAKEMADGGSGKRTKMAKVSPDKKTEKPTCYRNRFYCKTDERE